MSDEPTPDVEPEVEPDELLPGDAIDDDDTFDADDEP